MDTCSQKKEKADMEKILVYEEKWIWKERISLRKSGFEKENKVLRKSNIWKKIIRFWNLVTKKKQNKGVTK